MPSIIIFDINNSNPNLNHYLKYVIILWQALGWAKYIVLTCIICFIPLRILQYANDQGLTGSLYYFRYINLFSYNSYAPRYTLVTSMFQHSSVDHIMSNCSALSILWILTTITNSQFGQFYIFSTFCVAHIISMLIYGRYDDVNISWLGPNMILGASAGITGIYGLNFSGIGYPSWYSIYMLGLFIINELMEVNKKNNENDNSNEVIRISDKVISIIAHNAHIYGLFIGVVSGVLHRMVINNTNYFRI